jgi:hypothetical protein
MDPSRLKWRLGKRHTPSEADDSTRHTFNRGAHRACEASEIRRATLAGCDSVVIAVPAGDLVAESAADFKM